jgi:hypothetical protein
LIVCATYPNKSPNQPQANINSKRRPQQYTKKETTAPIKTQTKQNKTKQNKTKQNKTKQNKTKQNKTTLQAT